MILEAGKIYKGHLTFLKKVFFFECGDHAMVLEKEKGQVTLYAANRACSEIYCEIPLGKPAIASKQFVAICFSQDIMLLDGQDLLVVIDYGAKKVAVNQPQIKALGKPAWGEDVQIPWENRFNAMFGLDVVDSETPTET